MNSKFMNTEILTLENELSEIVKKASDLLHQGAIIAFPTETVYGIGCLMSKHESISEIFRLKCRKFNNPLAAHIGNIQMAERLSEKVPELFYSIAEKFLPGPLSIVIAKSKFVPYIATSGLESIGIRFPENRVFTAIAEEAGEPLVATSANMSGDISPVSGKQVIDTFSGKIPLIIDTGGTKYKKDSTVIKISGNNISILRKGAIDVEEFKDFF